MRESEKTVYATMETLSLVYMIMAFRSNNISFAVYTPANTQ